MPLLKTILDANILITKVQLEMSRGFGKFQESIPFFKETSWLFDTYSRKIKFVLAPNVDVTVLERFRKDTLLVHELLNRLSLRKGKEIQILERFLRSNRIQLEDSIIKMTFLHYKERYAYFDIAELRYRFSDV